MADTDAEEITLSTSAGSDPNERNTIKNEPNEASVEIAQEINSEFINKHDENSSLKSTDPESFTEVSASTTAVETPATPDSKKDNMNKNCIEEGFIEDSLSDLQISPRTTMRIEQGDFKPPTDPVSAGDRSFKRSSSDGDQHPVIDQTNNITSLNHGKAMSLRSYPTKSILKKVSKLPVPRQDFDTFNQDDGTQGGSDTASTQSMSRRSSRLSFNEDLDVGEALDKGDKFTCMHLCGFRGYWGEVEEHEKVCSCAKARFGRAFQLASATAKNAVKKVKSVGSQLRRNSISEIPSPIQSKKRASI